MEPVHVVACTDNNSGFEALYIGGKLKIQGDTIYAADIAKAVGKKIIQFSHICVDMPDNVDSYPKKFDVCMGWKAN